MDYLTTMGMNEFSKQVISVTGPISAAEIGPTLAHEHLYCDLSVSSGRQDNILTDTGRTVRELSRFRDAGGRTIIEVTPEGLGRDPLKLREISLESGVQIVSGIAFYDRSTYPAWVREAAGAGSFVTRISDYFVRQIEEGDGGVRAGIIGELTSHNQPGGAPADYRLDEIEAAVFMAAALAQQRTNVGITTHAALGRGGRAQLDVLERAGADPRRICIGHCDAEWNRDPEEDLGYYLAILERGAICGFDLIGWTDLAPDDIRADRIAALVRLGYAESVVLSTDTCRQSHLYTHGGRGYDYLWTSFLPRLRSRGITAAQIESMLITAPQRLMTGR